MNRCAAQAGARSADGRRGASRAFTLIEVLISVTIVAMLVALLLPALRISTKAARGFRCQMSLRSVGFDFAVFANDELHGDRGEDSSLGDHRFRVETFQESQYSIDEFWRWGGAATHTLPDAANNDPMRCSEVKGEITVRRDTACGSGAITPPQHVSFGFNLRLHRLEVEDALGRPRAVEARLTERILEHGMVPLAWDVDGAEAFRKDAQPVFSAPSLDSRIFPGDRYWYPGLRHNGAANFVFVDGHVKSSARPLGEPGWDWAFQPAP